VSGEAADGTPGATAQPGSSWFGRHGGKLVASLAVAAAFAWLLHRGALPLAPGAASFARVRWWTIGAYLVLWSGVHVLRAARWKWLLDPICPVPMRRILGVSFVGFAAIMLLPLRTGEAVRPVLIRQPGKLSGWAATGTIAAERILDGLFLSLMLLAGLALSTPLSPLPERIGDLPVSPAFVPRAAYAALILFAGAFLVMGIFYARRAWARRMTLLVVGAVSPRLARWLADRVEHVADGLRFLPNLRATAPFVGMTAVYWLLNSAGVWLVAWGSGFDTFSYAEACVTIGVVALGILVPNGPGFFGAYQLAFYAALAVFYPPDMVIGPGAACVLLVYCSQVLITLGAGALGLALERPRLGAALASDADAENLAAGAPPR
jgi:hypothetical protein